MVQQPIREALASYVINDEQAVMHQDRLSLALFELYPGQIAYLVGLSVIALWRRGRWLLFLPNLSRSIRRQVKIKEVSPTLRVVSLYSGREEKGPDIGLKVVKICFDDIDRGPN